ncbi:hypothetical protein JW899_05175 [Candidatus Uhrbacteria bacterium]|nr:hypothetical protein [Candidatus Uhrbacteria bacterium]
MDISGYQIPNLNNAPLSETAALAREIACAFGEPHRVGMYVAAVRRMGGPAEARRHYREICADGARDCAKVFMWRSRKNR